jgi:hypothetical protein
MRTITCHANPINFSCRRSQGVLVPDRRRHKPIQLTLPGRCMRENKEEHPCRLVDMAGGVAILSPVRVADGERLIAYFDHIGGIAGCVVRCCNGGFAIKINATRHKREKLAAQLTWLANRAELAAEGRRHDRITLNSGDSTLQLGKGATITCRVLDVSVSGASVARAAARNRHGSFARQIARAGRQTPCAELLQNRSERALPVEP